MRQIKGVGMPARFVASIGCVIGVFLTPVLVAAEHEHAMHHHEHEMIDFSADFAVAQFAKEITVEQCWVRLMPAQVPSAGYFKINNQQDSPIELLAARTDSFGLTMLHQTYEEDGLAKMKETDGLLIEPHQHLSFEPGGYHVMFEQPTGSLEVGDKMDLELLFGHEQKVTAACRVNSAKARSY